MRQLCAQPRRIAYFYERADTSTFRYRVFNPGLTLAANPSHEVSGAWFDRSDLSADDGFIVEADALVICRARYNSAVAQMISRARATGIPVLFDCDDLVFDTDRLHLLLDSLNLNQRDEAVWNDWFAKVSRTGAVLRLCDAFVTTNEYLAERAKEYQPQLRTAIMPNYLNPQQQALSETLYNAKREFGLGEGRQDSCRLFQRVPVPCPRFRHRGPRDLSPHADRPASSFARSRLFRSSPAACDVQR